MNNYIYISLERSDSSFSVKIGKDKPFRLLSVSGLESSDYSLSFSHDAQSDFSYLSGYSVSPRIIKLCFELSLNSLYSVYRENVIRFFSPKSQGKMYVDISGIKRKINYNVKKFEFLNENLYDPLKIRLELACPDPYFKDANGFVENITTVIPMISFPTRLLSSGTPASYKKFGDLLSINNPGDIPVGLDITVLASGFVVNPKIENVTSGKFIRLIGSLSENDVLRIVTIPGKKRITKNGTNISNLLDRSSSFFSLELGENRLKVSASSGKESLDVFPMWEAAYFGI